MAQPVIILGGGGHAKVLADTLLLKKIKILGFVDLKQKKFEVAGKKIKYLGGDEWLLKSRMQKKVLLINGIGSVSLPVQRHQIFEKFKKAGFRFEKVIHPSAIIAKGVRLGEGAQVMAGAVIQTGCEIGINSIINTRASVDHDCKIGAHTHIAPGVTLCGGIGIGEQSHIGVRAVVIQGVQIGPRRRVLANELVKTDN